MRMLRCLCGGVTKLDKDKKCKTQRDDESERNIQQSAGKEVEEVWSCNEMRRATASMAEWLRAWDTLAMMKLWRREVVSSILDRGTIVG